MVHHAEIPSGEGLFLCSSGSGCGQHFYVLCTAYLCSTIAITRDERETLRRMDGPEAKLAWLGLRAAMEPGAPLAEAA